MNTLLQKSNTHLIALAIIASLAGVAVAQQPPAAASEEILATSATNKVQVSGGPGWCPPDKPAQMTMTLGAGSPLSSTAEIIAYAGRLRLSVLAASCPSAQAAIVTVRRPGLPEIVLAARAPTYEFRQVESAIDAQTKLERPAPAGVDLDDGSLVGGASVTLTKFVGSAAVEIGEYKLQEGAPVSITLRKAVDKLLPTAAFPKESRLAARMSGKLVITSATPATVLLSVDLTSSSPDNQDYVCSASTIMDGKPISELELGFRGTRLADLAPILAAGIHDFVVDLRCQTKTDILAGDRGKPRGFLDSVVTIQAKLPGEKNLRPLRYNDLMTTPPAPDEKPAATAEPAPAPAATAKP